MIYKASIGILLISFSFFQAWASAPSEEMVSLKPLVVTWDSNLAIEKLGWQGKESQKLTKNKKLTLSRVKYPREKSILIVISKDSGLAPLILEVSNDQLKLHLDKTMFKKSIKGELWLWGETPLSLCGGHTVFHLRFLNKKSIFTNFSGLFAWKIKIDELPSKPAFYLSLSWI